MADNTFKILSIDGGGVRGVFAAKILSLMETKFSINIKDQFDLIVGTSTGSIIAAAISINYDLNQLVEDYRIDARKIFQKRWSINGMVRSKYDSKFLEDFLSDKLGKTKLGKIEKPLILNATNVMTGDVYIFKSSYQKVLRGGRDYVRDGETQLYKAVLASCSAPMYFDPVDINGTLVCDGGVWANNPSLVGYIDAINNFQVAKNNIKILSIGTGQTKQFYQTAKKWGFLTGWKATKLIDFLMSCQTQFPMNVLALSDPNMTIRIDPVIDKNYHTLDDSRSIPTLISYADSEFTERNKEISDFLSLPHP